MPCLCETYQCLDVPVNGCHGWVELPILASASGEHRVTVEFNGMSNTQAFEAVEGENYIVPNLFNGQYVHRVMIYRPGVTTPDCYKIRTMPSTWNNTLPYPPAPADGFAPVSITLTTEMISEDTLSFTFAGIAGKQVLSFDTDSQSPNRAQFTQAGNTITRIDGGSFYDSQVITLHFGTIDS